MIYYQGKMAGSIGLLRINRHHRSAEMGFWLSRDNEGQSIMSTAARLLVNYVFDQTTIHRLEIKIPSGNVRAQRIPHVLGFQHEGTLRQGAFQHGQFLDLELYALLRSD
jgi:RimJ/RimL family protein N-acetyltransferase